MACREEFELKLEAQRFVVIVVDVSGPEWPLR